MPTPWKNYFEPLMNWLKEQNKGRTYLAGKFIVERFILMK
jgi:hypothetical protein